MRVYPSTCGTFIDASDTPAAASRSIVARLQGRMLLKRSRGIDVTHNAALSGNACEVVSSHQCASEGTCQDYASDSGVRFGWESSAAGPTHGSAACIAVL